MLKVKAKTSAIYSKTLPNKYHLPAPGNVLFPNYYNTRTYIGYNLLPWANSGGGNLLKKQFGIKGNSILLVKGNVNLF